MRRRDFLKHGGLWIPTAAAMLNPTRLSAATLISQAFGYTATTSPIDTTNATLIVIHSARSAAAPQTPTDSAGNAWTPLSVVIGGTLYNQFFYKVSPTTSATHTFTPGASSVICVAAFSGAGAHDSGGTNTDYGEGSTTATEAMAPLTPTATGDLIVTGFSTFFNDAAASVADNDGASDPTIIVSDNRSGYTQKLAWKTYASTSALTISWTGTISNNNTILQAAFLASGGGGGAVPARRRPVSY